MKCQQCQKEGFRYNQRLKKEKASSGHKTEKRTDFSGRCKKCGFKGDIR